MLTDDPIADFERHERQQQEQLERFPVCCECDKPITDEHYFEINGECLCEGCLNEHHRKWTDDYVG